MMKTTDELETIFAEQFERGMIRKDLKAFKRDFPTLYRVILLSLITVNVENNQKR